MSRQLPLALKLKPSARFSAFVAGANLEVTALLKRIAETGDEPLLYCWGAAGLGKTHLLQACCQLATDRQRSAAYLSLMDASQLAPALLDGWENYDLVCLDDIDSVAGDRDWEEALFHLYNRIRDRHGSLVASAHAAPAQVPFSLPDLASRLGSGPVYQLKPLDDEQRLRALQLRAGQRGCEMPDETGRYLLRRLPRDMPALFDFLDQLDEASLVAQRRLTVPFVKSVLGL